MGSRSYGSRRIYVRTDGQGPATFYGSWYAGGRRMNRRLGAETSHEGRNGLTKADAEKRLRELMASQKPTTPRGDRPKLSEASDRS